MVDFDTCVLKNRYTVQLNSSSEAEMQMDQRACCSCPKGFDCPTGTTVQTLDKVRQVIPGGRSAFNMNTNTRERQGPPLPYQISPLTSSQFIMPQITRIGCRVTGE